MPVDVTAEKCSDLRVAAIRGAHHPSTAPAVGPMTPASVTPKPSNSRPALSGLVDRLPGAANDSDVPVLTHVVALFDMPELPVDGTTRGAGRQGTLRLRRGADPARLVAAGPRGDH